VASFNNAYRRVLAGGSPSHAWIGLHRVVEAFCRTSGRDFNDVFAELEQRFDFSRGDTRRWPELATMKAAATMLHEERERVLALRRALGARDDAAARAELRAFDAQVRAHAGRARHVGVWGWRRLRTWR
jgi:hypothetical protein